MKTNKKSDKKRIIIVGGGFGGIQLLEKLKKTSNEVIIIDKNNFHTFQPFLYQLSMMGLEPSVIGFPIRKMIRNYKNCSFYLGEVIQIDRGKSELYTTAGVLAYDVLVIATGSKPSFYGMKSLKEGLQKFKTMYHAIELRNMIIESCESSLWHKRGEKQSSQNFAVIGGGPTGVELIGAYCDLRDRILDRDYPELRKSNSKVVLIEKKKRILPMMSKRASDAVYQYLSRKGVEIITGEGAESYQNGCVHLESGRTVCASTIVWNAGVSGNSLQGLPEASLSKNKRICVDSFHKVFGTRNIYAIGDVSCMIRSNNSVNGDPMLAPVAIQQAQNLAQNLLGKKKEFVYKDKGMMAVCGRNYVVADIGRFTIKGRFAWFLWVFVHLIELVKFRNKFRTLFGWIWLYFNYDRSWRIILNDKLSNKVDRLHEREWCEAEKINTY